METNCQLQDETDVYLAKIFKVVITMMLMDTKEICS